MTVKVSIHRPNRWARRLNKAYKDGGVEKVKEFLKLYPLKFRLKYPNGTVKFSTINSDGIVVRFAKSFEIETSKE